MLLEFFSEIMNKNIIRVASAFAICLGLAYLGNKIVIPNSGVSAAGATPAAGAGSYVVYPDSATEAALGLGYATFSGHSAQDVTVTPLPPHVPGAAMLRVLPGDAQSLDISLNDARCGSPVHISLYRINDKQAVAGAVLDAKARAMSIPFSDGKIPAMLLEMRMGEKAQNNYWCGVNVHWSRKQGPAA